MHWGIIFYNLASLNKTNHKLQRLSDLNWNKLLKFSTTAMMYVEWTKIHRNVGLGPTCIQSAQCTGTPAVRPACPQMAEGASTLTPTLTLTRWLSLLLLWRWQLTFGCLGGLEAVEGPAGGQGGPELVPTNNYAAVFRGQGTGCGLAFVFSRPFYVFIILLIISFGKVFYLWETYPRFHCLVTHCENLDLFKDTKTNTHYTHKHTHTNNNTHTVTHTHTI